MLVRAYRTHQPTLLLGLLVLVPALWSGVLWNGSPAEPGQQMLFYQPFARLFATVPWSAALIGALVTMGLAVQVDALANDRELFERRNHLAALLFPILLAIGPWHMAPDPALLGMPLVLFALRRTWGTQGRARALGDLFDAGALVGLAALFYAPYSFLLVVLWASIAVMRPFGWRDYLVPALGIGVVMSSAWSLAGLFAPERWHLATTLSVVRSSKPEVELLRDRLAPALVLLVAVPAILSFARLYGRSIMREKNARAAYLAFAFAMALLLALQWLLGRPMAAVLVASPLAILLAYPLQTTRRTWVAEVAAYALLAAALAGQWTG
ncbi:MAG: hypothetical protein IPG10_01820 [Flavobacteriales bacterium]|jgi:hypothetical protein|nr:hypothetical protein [Flavobacteriales bacterium]MBK6753059.1 hypothetical protein [Flavobacteriales bacterium]MBK7085680.1 hypothetical protein [Flavobacteriales bacterium]MBK7752737.1 hypothetical protein [Flavobacteriales bacterium]MBK9077568.1 hypothetical protein [Flavobacteriales bacterium]